MFKVGDAVLIKGMSDIYVLKDSGSSSFNLAITLPTGHVLQFTDDGRADVFGSCMLELA